MTRPLSEAQWQARVVDYARWARWRVYHVGDSRTVTDRGFPDLVLIRERVIFAELKTDTGRVTAEQADYLDALRSAGALAAVWRPKDWDEVQKWLAPYGRTHP